MFLKSGLCGISLATENYCIGLIQLISSFCLVIFAIVRICQPWNFIKEWDSVLDDPDLKKALLDQNDEVAVEILMGAASTLIASSLLLAGLRKRSPGLIYPWIIITLVQFFGGIIVFVMNSASRQAKAVGVGRILAFVAYHFLVVYFLWSVSSYRFQLLKHKRCQRNILNNDLGTAGFPSSEMVSFSMHSSTTNILDDVDPRDKRSDASNGLDSHAI